jgi:hypothetical protein
MSSGSAPAASSTVASGASQILFSAGVDRLCMAVMTPDSPLESDRTSIALMLANRGACGRSSATCPAALRPTQCVRT